MRQRKLYHISTVLVSWNLSAPDDRFYTPRGERSSYGNIIIWSEEESG